MNILKRIQQLSVPQLFQLTAAFMKKPLYLIPTLQATKETMKVCNSLFGKSHHKSNKANAFRHALWNFLIAEETMKISKNESKAVAWTLKITNLYEIVTQNDILDQEMDLHNNEIGRRVFLKQNSSKREEIVSFLQKMSQNAKKITNIDEIEDHKDRLVYISEA